MALNDAATLVVGKAHYFTAEPGTAKPADYTSISGGWEEIGHTDIDEVLGTSSEGGDVTVLGTLQNRSLRTSKSRQTDAFSLTLQQFDVPALRLYHGANATVGPDGAFRVPGTPVPTRKAFLAVLWDGENVLPIYAPLTEISRGEDVDLSNPDELAGLPLSIQPLNYEGNEWPYEFGPIVPASGD